MRKYVWWPLLLLTILSSCTGSKTDEASAVLSVAVNPPAGVAGAPLIRFYDTASLTPGGSSFAARKVSEWALDVGDPIVATLYQPNIQGGAGDQLWVLTQKQLRRYSTAGFNTGGTFPAFPPPPNAVTSPVLGAGVDCSRGYLRLGANFLLVVCPPPDPLDPNSTNLPVAWRVDLKNPTLDPATNPPLNLINLATLTPLRLTIDNQDRLLYLGRTTIGIGLTRTTNDIFQNFTFGLPSGPTGSNSAPSDFAVLTDTRSNTTTAYGLYKDPNGTDNATRLLTWDLGGPPTFVAPPTPETNLSARFFAAGGPPPVVLGGPTNGTNNTTNGNGLARFDGAYKRPPFTPTNPVLDPNLQYSSAVLGLDQYLYAAQFVPGVAGGIPTLWVLDFFGPTENLTTGGRIAFALDTTNVSVPALAYVPIPPPTP